MIQSLVAKPIPQQPWTDPDPAVVNNVLIGNKYHAADVTKLLQLGVTAVLNCASGGISTLPVDLLKESGIRYEFTNVQRDDYSYPILHDKDGKCSKHLQIAKALYGDVIKSGGGKVLFFCVAGQNRSAALAIAVMMLYGQKLDSILEGCAQTRPFILENVGFQRQLVELEAILKKDSRIGDVYGHGTPPPPLPNSPKREISKTKDGFVEIELLIPGLCTMDVFIPIKSTIQTVKKCLVDHANKHLLAYLDQPATTISSSWVVLAMFGFDSMYDFPLEVAAIDPSVQLKRMQNMFHLEVDADQNVQWTGKCRFALVIFSVLKASPNGKDYYEEPWTFAHKERPGAPATLLANTLMNTHLRGWDFVTGQAFCSDQPIVFSFSNDPKDKRQFMKISTSANEAQQFHAPGEGGILGMGANAIVHRVRLEPTSCEDVEKRGCDKGSVDGAGWDAAVKRPFSLAKMLGALENSSEAGLAKRMRMANSLNSDGRVLFFYGLGVALSANAIANNHNEYKFEATLMSKYEEKFSTYTMKRFIADYTAPLSQVPEHLREEIAKLQSSFTLISAKLLLVSLLNAFRDLTLMGVQAFDFNHMNNVLVSRDHQTVRLIDIDGDSKGSIQFPSEYIQGSTRSVGAAPHKPSLDIDLDTVLPTVVLQLILGKGRGPSFVTNTRSEIWRAQPEKAKEIIGRVIRENFYADDQDGDKSRSKHTHKVAEWFYALLKKSTPWNNWTNDIYDAMRCIDHLPIT